MREIVYQLVKEHYQDWIHWNVKKNYSEKARKKTVLVFWVLVAAFVIGGIYVGKSAAALTPTLLIGIGGGLYILKSTSMEGQEKMLWKRTGLEQLEKKGNFPVVHLQFKQAGLVMNVENQEMVKSYGYKEILGLEEIDRLFLMETEDKTWQFVAKSAFADRAEMDQFLDFMNAKMEAAKENPERYSQEAMIREDENPDEAAEQKGDFDCAAEETKERGILPDEAAEQEDEAVIEHVDTSRMGKIGKMAHIMAAMAAEEADGELGAEQDNRTKESARIQVSEEQGGSTEE